MPKRDKYLFVVAGPTAVGKTKVALHLAKAFNAPVISADSRQIYKEMSIGTAKPSPLEIEEGPIHLVDYVGVEEYYSAGRFEKDAIATIKKIFQDHDIVILSGGTGLYIDAVLFGLDDFPKVDKKVRDQLEADLKTLGFEQLQRELKEKDTAYYDEVDIENPRRVLRALGVIRQSGQPYSSFKKAQPKKRAFKVKACILESERQELYGRINERVDNMLDRGLLDEVKALIPYKELKSLQTVGYQELFPYLEGKVSLEDAVEEIKKFTRRYAKRQLTWLKRYDWPRFNPAEIKRIEEYFEDT